MKMSRSTISFTAFLGGILFLAAFYASGLYANTPGATTGPWPAIGAAAVIVANGFGLLMTSNRVSVKATVSVPFIYIALVAANPWALHWSAFHPASLLMLGSIFCYLSFCAVRPSMEYLAGGTFLLGAAGLFVPPVLWIFPIFLLMGVGKATAKVKYLVISVIGLVLPLLILAGITYLRQGADAVLGLLPSLWERMTDVHLGIRHFSAATLARILLTLVATLMAVVHIVGQLNTYKTVQFLALVRLIMMAVALSVMALLFPEDAHTPCGLIICLPVTLLQNEYMAARGNERTKTALAIIAFLLLVAERVSLFL